MGADPFGELAQMFLADNALYGAFNQAERELDALDEGYDSVMVVERAWGKLSPVEQERSMETLFNSHYHVVMGLREREEVFRKAREAGETYLEHDDLEIIQYSLTGALEDPEYAAEIDKYGTIWVPLDALSRLVQEVKLLQARLEIRDGT